MAEIFVVVDPSTTAPPTRPPFDVIGKHILVKQPGDAGFFESRCRSSDPTPRTWSDQEAPWMTREEHEEYYLVAHTKCGPLLLLMAPRCKLLHYQLKLNQALMKLSRRRERSPPHQNLADLIDAEEEQPDVEYHLT